MIIKRDMLYTAKQKNRALHIYLPDDYDSSEERYPVMYFFDGHNLFFDSDATYGKSWGLKDFLDSWQKKIMIVGIECGHEGRERLDEYSPYSFASDFIGAVNGMGDVTMRWIIDEIKPLIDSTYRTWPHREATGIGGSSMGGLMSLYAGIRYNAVFSKAACLSSAVHPCMSELIRDLSVSAVDPDSRFYLSWGTEEAGGTHEKPEDDWKTGTALCSRRIAELLEKHGADVSLFCQRGGRHCEADWEKQLPVFMNYLWLEG